MHICCCHKQDSCIQNTHSHTHKVLDACQTRTQSTDFLVVAAVLHVQQYDTTMETSRAASRATSRMSADCRFPRWEVQTSDFVSMCSLGLLCYRMQGRNKS